MKWKHWAFVLLAGLLSGPNGAMGQAILPNATTTFVDANGAPLAGGFVFFYIPGTTTPKTTWVDSGLTTPNTNPVVLNAAGRANIWGQGIYREVVEDINGNVQWDQLTDAPLSSVDVTGSGAVVLQNSPTINSPTITSPSISNPTVTGTLIVPGIAGGTAANSSLTLASTTNGSPSGDSVTIESAQVNVHSNGGATSTLQLGLNGVTGGILDIASGTTGEMVLEPANSASGTVTIPTGNYTLVGEQLANTFTLGQTFSSSVTMNGLSTSNQTTLLGISGGGALSIQTTSGTGAAVLAGTPTINTPLLNAPTAENLPNDAGTDYVCFDNGTAGITQHSTACNSSDERLKHDWLYAVPGLDAIMALQPGTFDWLDAREAKQDGRQMGLRAQDVQSVLPQLVSMSDDSKQITLTDGSTKVIDHPLSLDYAKLTLPLIVAVQQQQHELEAMKLFCLGLLCVMFFLGLWVYRRAR